MPRVGPLPKPKTPPVPVTATPAYVPPVRMVPETPKPSPGKDETDDLIPF